MFPASSVEEVARYLVLAAVLPYSADPAAPPAEVDLVSDCPPLAPNVFVVVPAEAPAPCVAVAVSKSGV